MTSLCNDGRFATVDTKQAIVSGIANTLDEAQQIDLRQFAPLIGLTRSNETQLMLFRDHRLKKLCSDYMPGLLFHVLLVSIGMIMLTIGFVNFLINLSVNWVRRTTTQKYAELFYINGAEMIAFGGDDHQDIGHRY